ncbi:response regulator transcription factor [Paenibacillus sp. FJAT-27812]|uniref:response regulator transcription factor n=1 Tax=Paenibacillus sp. FJAT-27812 TaxID=1684143 RepID=UPI0006A7F1AD|nr:response regulator [Paenibacillus sp. FJAT-27812]
MYQLLIVDDEIHAVRAVQAGVDWAELSISHIHVAHNIKQAMGIFGEHPIDIMICDIEMPQGSGIELLSWVRERHSLTESIFLTCHSNFTYAKEALQLGSLDYMLKPVKFHELRSVVQRGVEKINVKRAEHISKEASQYYAMLWHTNRPILMERFWQDVMDQRVSSNPERIRDVLQSRNLPIKETESFLPIMIFVQRWAEKLNSRDKKLMEYALRNAADHLILHGDEHSQLVRISSDVFVAILPAVAGRDRHIEDMRQICKVYIESCNRYFRCDISCYVGDQGLVHEMATRYDSLIRLKDSNLNRSNHVFFLSEDMKSSESIDVIQMNVWLKMLEQGAYDAILSESERYLNSFKEVGGLKAEVLQQFLQNFLQMLYYFMQFKEWQAYQVLGEAMATEQLSQAVRSVTDLQAWVKHALEQTINYCYLSEDTRTVMDRIRTFIKQHLDQAISREDIARHVNLHPDYLSRRFKKETGKSIVEYIVEEKIAMAKELLVTTDMSVSDIALCVGYSNFSYFSKVFKLGVHMNPNQYRKSKGQNCINNRSV